MNPFLKRIGLPADARAVVIHADDIGMSYGTVAGFPGLLDAGYLSSAAIMVPCPWFPGAAAMLQTVREHPRLDVGVHLTLNSEWIHYRWGPRACGASASSLLDAEGYFHRREVDVWRHAEAGAVEAELRAQIQAALSAGIDLTHMDSHMGTLFHPRLLGIYLQLADEHRLPAFVTAPDAAHIQSANLPPQAREELVRILGESAERGHPFFDRFYVTDLQRAEDRLAEVRRVLAGLPPGSMTYLILHPALDTPDLRAFAPDWPARVEDYRLLTDPAFGQLLDELGITVIGMRPLRDALRSQR